MSALLLSWQRNCYPNLSCQQRAAILPLGIYILWEGCVGTSVVPSVWNPTDWLREDWEVHVAKLLKRVD